MRDISLLVKSREFSAWRWLILLVTTAWTISISEGHVYLESDYLYLWFVVLPCVVFLLARQIRPKWAIWFALGYDVMVSLVVLVMVLLQVPPDVYYGFLPFIPMTVFIIEGIFLTAFLVLGTRPTLWFAYACDLAFLLLFLYLVIRHLAYPEGYPYLVAIFMIEGVLLTMALTRSSRRMT